MIAAIAADEESDEREEQSYGGSAGRTFHTAIITKKQWNIHRQRGWFPDRQEGGSIPDWWAGLKLWRSEIPWSRLSFRLAMKRSAWEIVYSHWSRRPGWHGKLLSLTMDRRIARGRLRKVFLG